MSSDALDPLPPDHFLCSICTNIFTEPVTTPCGHSFCKSCLSPRWNQGDFCQCPTCSKRFCAPPEMSTNSVLDEVSVQLKRRRVQIPEVVEGSLPVDCDICTGEALRAVRSCLVCQMSYCSVHLEPHLRFPGLKRHKLIQAVDNMEDRVCPIHNRALDLFCRDDSVSVCVLCLDSEHEKHRVVSMEEEGAQQKANIDSLMRRIQTMIDKRKDKIKEFTDSSGIRKEKVQKVNQNMDAVLNIFTTDMQKTRTKVRTRLQEKLQRYKERDERTIRELEEDIRKLQKKNSDLEELRRREDPLYVLQTLQSLSRPSELRDWTGVVSSSDVCLDTVRLAVAKLVHNFHSVLKILTEEEINKMKQYKESLTFDPNTAGRHLFVYNYDKRIKHHKHPALLVSDGPRRFGVSRVFSAQGFSSGRHYWEVRVGLRGTWDVGVAMETVSRNADVVVKPGNGFYAIRKDRLTYTAKCEPPKVLNLAPRPSVIGVFLDYDDGRASFYDVDRKVQIYSFTGERFKGKVFPYFYLYSVAKKSEPMELRDIYDCEGAAGNGLNKREEQKQEITSRVSGERGRERGERVGERATEEGERVRERVGERGERVGERGECVGERVREEGERGRERGERVGERVTEKGERGRERVGKQEEEGEQAGERGERVRERVGERGERVGERVTEEGERVRERVGKQEEQVGERARERGEQVRERVGEQ